MSRGRGKRPPDRAEVLEEAAEIYELYTIALYDLEGKLVQGINDSPESLDRIWMIRDHCVPRTGEKATSIFVPSTGNSVAPVSPVVYDLEGKLVQGINDSPESLDSGFFALLKETDNMTIWSSTIFQDKLGITMGMPVKENGETAPLVSSH